MISKGTIKVEDELKNSWCCSVRYRQRIPHAGGKKKIKKNRKEKKNWNNFEAQKNMRTYGKYIILWHFPRNEYEIGEERRAWTEKTDKS